VPRIRRGSIGAVALVAFALALACHPAPATGRYADVRGIRMYYEIHGHGPALVLLHGGTGNGTQFAKQIPAFAPHHRLVVPDLCAQGRTSDRPGPLTYHDMAEDVVALLATLNIERADFMGWSDGGIVGLDVAIHHPERVQRLVTFGANFSPDGLQPADVAWNDTATAASFGDGTRLAYVAMAPDPSHYEAAMTKILTMWRTEPNFTLEELGSIRSPTLVCAGEHDVVRREHSEQLARTIPGARLWIVLGASHGAMLEQPDLVNRTVLEFLRP
jgi:pimeloyl-ACP methyl ester carboxylesterase